MNPTTAMQLLVEVLLLKESSGFCGWSKVALVVEFTPFFVFLRQTQTVTEL